MEDLWFDPKLVWLVPFIFCGIIGGVFGTLAGILYGKEKYASFMLKSAQLLITVSIGSVIVGVVALVFKQPFGIWFSFIVTGFVGYICFKTCSNLFRTAKKQD